MRAHMLLLVPLALTACTSKPVHIIAGQCWSLSAGDKVQGTALLYIPSPFTFHVGPEVAGGPGCTRYPIKLAGKSVDSAFGQISDRLMVGNGRGGPTEGVVALSGNVISGVDRGSLFIEVTQLRSGKPTEP